MTSTTGTAYDKGFSDGYEQAVDSEIGLDGAIPELVSGAAATAWDADLINSIGADEAARHLGLSSLYADGDLTDEASRVLSEYNRGCTDGWNRRVDELAESDEIA